MIVLNWEWVVALIVGDEVKDVPAKINVDVLDLEISRRLRLPSKLYFTIPVCRTCAPTNKLNQVSSACLFSLRHFPRSALVCLLKVVMQRKKKKHYMPITWRYHGFSIYYADLGLLMIFCSQCPRFSTFTYQIQNHVSQLVLFKKPWNLRSNFCERTEKDGYWGGLEFSTGLQNYSNSAESPATLKTR